MWNPVTIAALSAAVVAIGGVVLAVIRQLQHQADPAAHAALTRPAKLPAPALADPWPPVSQGAPAPLRDVTGLTGAADPGQPPGVKDDG
jgi:hypothetical protein